MYEKFGQVRRMKKINQYQVAADAQCPQSTVSLVENGYKEPDEELARQLAEAIGEKAWEIFPGLCSKPEGDVGEEVTPAPDMDD